MSFHNSRFPLHLSYGSRGGPGYSTAITELGSGVEERVARWSSPKYRYDITSLIRSRDDMYNVVKFYHARNGPANSFRFLDWQDYSSASNGRDVPGIADVVIGIGDGSTKTFQLIKVYTEGSESRTRLITKPIHSTAIGDPYNLGSSASVRVSLNGVESLSGWTVNDQTGIITFTTAPGSGVVVAAGFYFDVPVRFGIELDELFGPTSEDFDVASIDSLVLVEDRSPSLVYEEMNYGGHKNWGALTADQAITLLDGRLHIFTDDTGYDIFLPDFTNIPTGILHFGLINLGGSANTDLKDSTGATLVTVINPDRMIFVSLGVDSGGQKLWIPSA